MSDDSEKPNIIGGNWTKYCKTPLISTYVFSGLVTEQVLIFGAVLTFGGYDKAEAKILQGRSLFNPVLSAHKTLLCMFQRLCTYFQDTGVLIFGGGGGYVLSGHCNQQDISVKTEGYLFSEGYLFTGFYFFWSWKNMKVDVLKSTIENGIALCQNLWVGVGQFERRSSSARASLALCGRFGRHILESRCAERCANDAFSTSFLKAGPPPWGYFSHLWS